jgi:hypothetical protein
VNYFNILWLVYGAGVAFLAAIAGIIRLCGHRGRAFRAFLVAPGAGLIVFWLTLGVYLLLVPIPIAPPHHLQDDNDLLSIFAEIWSFIFDNLAPNLTYKLGLYFDPVLYGALSIPIAFIASFYFPFRTAGVTSTPSASTPSATSPASSAAAAKSETGS